jgi:hypothetical protein
MTAARLMSATRISAERGQHMSAQAGAIVLGVAVGKRLLPLLEERPGHRDRPRLVDADPAPGDPRLDLAQDRLGLGLGRLARGVRLPLAVEVPVAGVPVRLGAVPRL